MEESTQLGTTLMAFREGADFFAGDFPRAAGGAEAFQLTGFKPGADLLYIHAETFRRHFLGYAFEMPDQHRSFARA